MQEVIEAAKLKQIVSKIETIEQEKADYSEALKDAFNCSIINVTERSEKE